jgi:GMP synthase-like glutamine amidotransferase
MKFLAILHVPQEGTGLIKEWINIRNHTLEEVMARDLKNPHGAYDFDFLIIMGGPMGVLDEEKHPWLKDEKTFIENAIDDGKKILGICLGSQMLAHCLGARVYKNPESEIGWFPVRKKFFMHSWFPVFDDHEKQMVFHWHGDTFDLPEGTVPLFESEGCKNQAFALDDQILGIQFHPEISEDLIQAFIDLGRNDLKPGRYIQSESRMLSNQKLYGETNKTLLFDLLDDFFIE